MLITLRTGVRQLVCVDPARIHGPRQITDVYLVAVATYYAGRFVTFDKPASCGAVMGGAKNNLLVL
ncbi:MAG: hypothetical protein ABI316_07835 [Casimicrobiaceae bacterium]